MYLSKTKQDEAIIDKSLPEFHTGHISIGNGERNRLLKECVTDENVKKNPPYNQKIIYNNTNLITLVYILIDIF